jgi:hypothetical protein
MALPEITGDLSGMAGASPKTVATISFLRLYEKYWDNMATNPDFIIDRGTAALIIACPEEEQRNRIWQSYIDEKAKSMLRLSQSGRCTPTCQMRWDSMKRVQEHGNVWFLYSIQEP